MRAIAIVIAILIGSAIANAQSTRPQATQSAKAFDRFLDVDVIEKWQTELTLSDAQMHALQSMLKDYLAEVCELIDAYNEELRPVQPERFNEAMRRGDREQQIALAEEIAAATAELDVRLEKSR